MEPERQVEGFFLSLLHEERFHSGLGLWKKKMRKRGRKKKKPIMLPYRYPNNGFPSWVSNSTSHLKRYSCCRWGCWSSGGQSSSTIKWPQGMQTSVLSPTEHSSNRKSCRACLPLLWTALPWSWPGEVGAPVSDNSRSRVPFVLSPLCVFLMGDKCEAHGVQSHCGLKRISDDRKYVNLLFPLERRKKYKASMDEEDNARTLYNVFPTKDFKVIFL